MGVNIENMAIIEQIFVDFAKKIEGSVWPANFLGVMQKSLVIAYGVLKSGKPFDPDYALTNN